MEQKLEIMARVAKIGSLGNLRGKVGEGVASKWRSLTVIKSLPAKRTKKQRKKRLSQQLSLPLVSGFLGNFVHEIKIGFHNKQAKLPPFQAAVKYNYERALLGTSPDFSIDYKKVVFSLGDREIAWAGKVVAEGNGARISWEIPQTSKIKLIGEDIANLVIFNATKDLRPGYEWQLSTRADLSFYIRIQRGSWGDHLHFWLFFTSPDGKTRSNSQYMGSIGS